MRDGQSVWCKAICQDRHYHPTATFLAKGKFIGGYRSPSVFLSDSSPIGSKVVKVGLALVCCREVEEGALGGRKGLLRCASQRE